jgi:hypothetical protein
MNLTRVTEDTKQDEALDLGWERALSQGMHNAG